MNNKSTVIRSEINPIVIDFNDKKMVIVSQTHTKNGTVQIKYKGDHNTAMVLLRPDGMYDEYLYDPDGVMIRYNSKEVD